MITKSRSRAAAWTAAAILTATAGSYFYWSLGAIWDLPQSGTTASTSQIIGTAMIGVLGLAFAGVLLVRAGYWRGHAPADGVDRLAKLVVLIAFGGALAQFAEQRFVAGAVNLVVALLAFVVTRSDLPPSPPIEHHRGLTSRA